MTVGPADMDPTLTTKRGKASHICAAAKNGPRYDPKQTPEERASIQNGIWLCSGCADLVDKNGGIDYPPTVLRQWKAEHEKMIAQLVKAGSSPLSLVRKNTAEGVIAQELVDYFDQKGALFVDYAYERNDHVILSLRDIREHLVQMMARIDVSTPLYGQVRTVIELCRRYMNEMSNQNDHALMIQHLGVMRKGIGLILRGMCEQYGARPGANLTSIMPM
jgi:hypothetical protein